MYINIAKVDFGRYDSGGEPQLNGLYITPADASAINVTPNDSYYTLHGKYLKYSFNGKKWKNWNGSVTIEPEQKMYLKGEDDYVWDISRSGKLITADGYYNVGGDISSLTNFITEVKNYTFSKLFSNDSYIKDASSLILPANTLVNSCYNSMFYKCTALTTAPILPATTLAYYCYSNMFQGCTSLITAPELPATTLADWCYSNMFQGCTLLNNVHALHATTLADGCYSNMFNNCTLLNAAPELPATTLADSCYQGMFYGCTSLTTAHELPATTLSKYCYDSMFSWCSSLTTAPELPATTLSSYCYDSMFSRCTSLTTAPELPATTLAAFCYQEMFSDCSKLNNITMLATDISAQKCLNNWVNGVASTGTFTKAASMTTLPTGVNGIPEGWTVKDYGAQPTFYGIRGTANVTSTTLSNAISFNDTNYDVHVDENGKWEIEYNDPIYTSSNAQSLCNSNNITSIDFRNTIWSTRSQTNKNTFDNLFFDGSVSNLQDVYFDFTGQNTNDMCLNSGIFGALTNCRIHGFGTLNWNGEINVSETTSKHAFSLREFNRNGIIGTLDLRGIDTTSITDQDVSSIHQSELSFDWIYGYWYLFPNFVYCDTIIIGSLEIQTDYFKSWFGPSDHCKTLYCTSPTPPSLSRTGAHGLTCYNWLSNLSSLQNIYVPVGCLEAYTNDSDWSAKASIISEKEAPDPLSI